MRELIDTTKLMISKDYKDRFKAEYYQTVIRFDKLYEMIVKYENGTLEFKPTCSIDILKKQKDIMFKYIGILEERAKIEKINL